MPHLIFIKEGKPILQRPFDQTQIFIGRDASCDIQLFEPEISRRHCLIERQNGFFILKDLSKNGTLLNRKKITEKKLGHRDEIGIGPWNLQLILEDTHSPAETLVIQKEEVEEKNGLGPMLGTTRTMKKIFELIRKAAPSDTPVCLLGESGTGKELAAKLIHQLSLRRSKPFVAINCGAIPSNLIESMLFGHERGSFTGASERHTGVFEQADGGTLFLDEIGEMPTDLQTRLLRVLEEKTVRRVGGKSDIAVDVRLITATLQNLEERAADGVFRKDLFFRLYVFPIALPPLRERKEDIPLLAGRFLETLATGEEKKTLSQGAIQKLRGQKWPGNVRELKNVIQRAVLLSKDAVLTEKDLEFISFPTAIGGEIKNLARRERESIVSALKKMKGNHARTASFLGIARSTLASKLRRYKLEPSEWD